MPSVRSDCLGYEIGQVQRQAELVQCMVQDEVNIPGQTMLQALSAEGSFDIVKDEHPP